MFAPGFATAFLPARAKIPVAARLKKAPNYAILTTLRYDKARSAECAHVGNLERSELRPENVLASRSR